MHNIRNNIVINNIMKESRNDSNGIDHIFGNFKDVLDTVIIATASRHSWMMTAMLSNLESVTSVAPN